MKASKWFLELGFLTKIGCLGAQCLWNIRLGCFFPLFWVFFSRVCVVSWVVSSPPPSVQDAEREVAGVQLMNPTALFPAPPQPVSAARPPCRGTLLPSAPLRGGPQPLPPGSALLGVVPAGDRGGHPCV